MSQDVKRCAVAGQSVGKHAVIVRQDGQNLATLAGHETLITAIAFDKAATG